MKDYEVNQKKIKVVPRGVDLDQFTGKKSIKSRINMAEHFRIELDVPVILLPGEAYKVERARFPHKCTGITSE